MILLNAFETCNEVLESTASKAVPKSTQCEVTACYCCGLLEWECWWFCSALDDLDDDEEQESTRGLQCVMYNHNSSFYSVCSLSCVTVTSCLSFKWLEKRHLMCRVNVNESIGNQKSCGLWIDIDARVAFPIKTSFNAYLNCKAQMKGILCPISSQLIQFYVRCLTFFQSFQLLNWNCFVIGT